ncbi:hypothetical protein AB1Y20_004693 [Prymnesium parvum]|uniref:Methenyltetrahydrofolate cyclohydrolase n=1 Tax=Prymnesium parvum TaxID=97485 RepID=A0AB34IZI8_PRYPA
MPRRDATEIAQQFNQQIKAEVDAGLLAGRERPRLVGFLANDDAAAVMYARWTGKACEANGITFELRRVERVALEAAVIDANVDPSVHGIIVYYPVFGGQVDDYLRDVISIEKDVEGLNHRYRYALYHNIRTLGEVDGQFGAKKCVLPCTPLACLKILEATGAYDKAQPVGKQLASRTAVVFNRSEVVGRPLAAMLANDGAVVYSIDITGMLRYTAGSVQGTIKVEETSMAQDDALRAADIVVSGVPSKSFCIKASAVKPGAICVNFSQFQNFEKEVEDKCTLVPAIGKVTIAMLERNLLRLQANFSPPKRRAPGGVAFVCATVAAVVAIAAWRAYR